MDTNEIGAFGYAIAMIVYACLTILLLSGWQRSDQSRLPALATGISLVWAGVWTAGFLDLTRAYALVRFLQDRQWVINLQEMKRYPDRYENLLLDSWLRSDFDIIRNSLMTRSIRSRTPYPA